MVEYVRMNLTAIQLSQLIDPTPRRVNHTWDNDYKLLFEDEDHSLQ